MNLGETNVTLTHRKQQMSVETFFHFDVTGQRDRRIENLTRQIPNPAGGCPVTGRYFQPWNTFDI